MEENTLVNNTILQEEQFAIEEIEEDKSEDLANDSIALAYDYYDHYYEQITKSLSRIEVNTSTMIDNQNQLMDKLHAINTTCSSFTFIVTIIFVYTVIRNMIVTK